MINFSYKEKVIFLFLLQQTIMPHQILAKTNTARQKASHSFFGFSTIKHCSRFFLVLMLIGLFNISTSPAYATTFFSDNFNNDYGELSTHTPTVGTGWEQVISNNGVTLSVQSYNNDVNITTNTLNGGALYRANGTYVSADYEISSKVTNYEGSSSYPRSMAVRIQDANNMYLLRYLTTSMEVFKRVSGTWTSIGSATVTTIAVGDTVAFGVVGSALTAKVNGVTKLTATDSSISATGTAGIGFGYINISTDDSGTGQHIDDVVVTGIDNTAPTVTSVSSDKANGSYKAGEVVDIDVTFSEAVTSTGNVTVTLETGDIDQACTFTITNSTTGTCNYTVQTGDTSSDLNATISGTIADQANNALVNYVPATTLAQNKALTIDTTAPTVNAGSDQTKNAIFNQNATVSDATSGIGSYQWMVQSGPGTATFGTATSEDTTISVSDDGTYIIRLVVTDFAGNSAYDELALVWDATAPPTPVASPSAGTYTSSQSITLSSAGSSAIYYTIDGSTPTTGSTLYSSAITVDSSMTINALSVDEIGNESPPLSAVYSIIINPDTPPLSPVVNNNTSLINTSGTFVSLPTNNEAASTAAPDNSSADKADRQEPLTDNKKKEQVQAPQVQVRENSVSPRVLGAFGVSGFVITVLLFFILRKKYTRYN